MIFTRATVIEIAFIHSDALIGHINARALWDCLLSPKYPHWIVEPYGERNATILCPRVLQDNNSSPYLYFMGPGDTMVNIGAFTGRYHRHSETEWIIVPILKMCYFFAIYHAYLSVNIEQNAQYRLIQLDMVYLPVLRWPKVFYHLFPHLVFCPRSWLIPRCY